jgi:membrane dipeptidase
MIRVDDDFIFDCHLDLAMNAIEWNRDLKQTVADIRKREERMVDKPDRGKGTVAFPELRKGNVGVIVATQIARYVRPGSELPGWNSPEIAWAITQAQLAWYRAMENQGELRQITNLKELQEHLAQWNDSSAGQRKAIGYILSLEGADSIVDLSYLEKAYAYGLRACGPAHYGPGRYAPGTGTSGPLTKEGRELVKEMDRLHMILDVTHLTDEGFEEALSIYKGPVWASHHNCRTLVQHQRQLTDDQIKVLISRDAVIGGVLDTWMLTNNWIRGKDNPEDRGVNLEKLIDHFDHICQLAGNSLHIAIGSDLDGAYGKEQSPYDLEDISDLQNLKTLLTYRGYSREDVSNIFHGNWLRFLQKAWK